MTNPTHKDILGQKINTGDHVAYPVGTSMKIGMVSKITPKMINIVDDSHQYYPTRRYPNDVVVIKDNKYLALYLLKQTKGA